MKKRFSTFAISCLLLAAFIGSAEAKKIDITNEAGAGLLQLATESDSRFLQGETATEWAVAETDDSIKWLLALYRVDDASDFPAGNTSSNSTDKTLPTNEGFEMDFSLGGGTLFGYELAGLVYGDPLESQTAAAAVGQDQQPSASPASSGGDSIVQEPGASGKIPVTSYATVPMTYLDPPTRVYTEEPPRPQKKDPKPEKTPGSALEKPPQVNPPADVVPPEVAIPTVYTEEQTRSKKKEPKPGKTPGSVPEKPPQAVNPPADVTPPKVIIPGKNPIFAGSSPSPEYPESNLPITGQNGVTFPDDRTIKSPAPVPEPATMLLFSAGIAGFAFGRLRRNKNTDEQNKE